MKTSGGVEANGALFGTENDEGRPGRVCPGRGADPAPGLRSWIRRTHRIARALGTFPDRRRRSRRFVLRRHRPVRQGRDRGEPATGDTTCYNTGGSGSPHPLRCYRCRSRHCRSSCWRWSWSAGSLEYKHRRRTSRLLSFGSSGGLAWLTS